MMSRFVAAVAVGSVLAVAGCGGAPGGAGGEPVVAPASAPASPVAKGDWSEFSPADKAFTVAMPIKPEERTSSEKLDDGNNLTHHIYIAAEKPENYLVDVMEVPFDVAEEGRKGLYDNMRDENVASRKAKTLEEKDVTVDGFAGRERLDEQPLKGGSLLTKTRSLLVGRRYFIVMATYFQAATTPPGVDRFLESFHPAPPPATPAESATPTPIADPAPKP